MQHTTIHTRRLESYCFLHQAAEMSYVYNVLYVFSKTTEKPFYLLVDPLSKISMVHFKSFDRKHICRSFVTSFFIFNSMNLFLLKAILRFHKSLNVNSDSHCTL